MAYIVADIGSCRLTNKVIHYQTKSNFQNWREKETMMTSWQRESSALLALCEGNPPIIWGFPSEMASNAELWLWLCFLHEFINCNEFINWGKDTFVSISLNFFLLIPYMKYLCSVHWSMWASLCPWPWSALDLDNAICHRGVPEKNNHWESYHIKDSFKDWLCAIQGVWYKWVECDSWTASYIKNIKNQTRTGVQWTL